MTKTEQLPSDFQTKIKNEAERILALFEQLQDLKEKHIDVFNYLKGSLFAESWKKVPLPTRTTMLQRIMVDIIAQQEILEATVRSEAAKKTPKV